jgi:hypothetical protein
LSMVICSPAPNLTAQALNDHLHKPFYTLHSILPHGQMTK